MNTYQAASKQGVLTARCAELARPAASHAPAQRTWQQPRVEHHIARDAHGVVEVALDLVENVLGGPPQQDGACLWVAALRDKGEKLVTDLLNLKETGLGADVALLDLRWTGWC